jgi:probable rRNA maturation factor
MNIMNERNNAHTIDVEVLEPEWKSSYLDVQSLVKDAILLTLNIAILPKILFAREVEISVVLANDDLIQVLNREYRDIDKPTNVLSFASLDSDDPIPDSGQIPLGDLILAYQTIDREAKEQDKFFKDHFTHLVVHGTLHLLGYDHINEDEATNMETLEIRILQKMNIQNPYMDKASMA